MNSLRARLAEATRATHERLHGHPGFAAAAAGEIGAEPFADLLARLYGFHAPLEARFARAPVEMAQAIALPSRRRAPILAETLAALGWAGDPDGLPHRPAAVWTGEPQWLGALYVTEGATLGGVQIGRALARAGYSAAQLRYFEAYGEDRSRLWRSLLARLESHAGDAAAERHAVAAANAQFSAFEDWMDGWRGASQARPAPEAVCAR